LGNISVNFDITAQLPIRYSAKIAFCGLLCRVVG